MDDELVPGLREELITDALARHLGEIDPAQVERSTLSPEELQPLALRHATKMVDEWLGVAKANPESDEAALVNELAEKLVVELSPAKVADFLERHSLVKPATLLTGIREAADGLSQPVLPDRPQVPLTVNELLVNDRNQPSLASQLRSELQSAVEVDLICAFVIWSGVTTILEQVRGVVERGGRVRIITTTYMGVTDLKAVTALQEAGAEVRVAFDAQRTKLHAKAWILHRPRGLSTAFVGSSNLSHQALHAGLEWNVRLAQAEAASVIERMHATFDTYWEDDAFEEFIAARDAKRLEAALARQRSSKKGPAASTFTGLTVTAYPHQRRMLEDLMVQRDRHDRHRNLVVAATGTGKTVVAALDYKALCDRAGRRLSVLFVAHREQILQQSRATFAAVLKDPDFGDIHGSGQVSQTGKHVFAMVQSLKKETIAKLDPGEFDVVIIDEFHHAQAPSYTALLDHIEPGELLGLTGTPERMDGKDVTSWFGGRIAVELRVWEAIDRGYLSPFQYFGVADDTDLTQITWKSGGYDTSELDAVVTGNHVRARRTAEAIERWHPQPATMRALGFCVSVAHAEFMAAEFTKLGIKSIAVSGKTPDAERRAALSQLQQGTLRCVFSVDVLGEGVDVPNVDTVLLLRPTQSATVFAQQIGRGLRLSEGKAYLTVIDLIGQHNKRFRFEERLRALVDRSNGPLATQAKEGFPFLPSGCSLLLDRKSEEIVMANLEAAAASTQWANLVDELRDLGDVDLDTWLQQTGRSAHEIYRNNDRSWTRLRRDAGLPAGDPLEGENALLKNVARLDHIDDPERTSFYVETLSAKDPPELSSLSTRQTRMLEMLLAGVGAANAGDTLAAAFECLWLQPNVRAELCELFNALDVRSERLGLPMSPGGETPLALHAQYTRAEILLAYGDGTAGKPSTNREGFRWLPEIGTDILFVTLRKSSRTFSPTTMYRDYALSDSLFHWESQNATHNESPTGLRYRQQRSDGTNVVLFVREENTRRNGRKGAPFTCLGNVDYVSDEGNRPMQITWRLRNPLPEALLEASQIIAAA